jgi:hypothetical protein
MAGTTRHTSFLAAGLFGFALLVLSSCGPRVAGYGVVLWGATGPDDPQGNAPPAPKGMPATGSVVGVIRQSEITGTYLLAVPGIKTGLDMATARVRMFRKKAEAAAFAENFAEYATTWGFSQKQDPPPLPIRDEAKQDAKTVYKLKPGQMVKVVGRSAEKQVIRPYTDYWYEVVTEDGFGGWVFGHFLKVFTAQADPAGEARRLMSQDETLDRILGSTWRPDYFREMVAKGRIDLSVFREDVGLFPLPSENMMRLVLPLSTFEFPYTGIEKLGASSYVFTGTDLRITVLDEERITLNYRIKDQPVSGLYAIMTDDVAELVASEQQRRADILAQFTRAGSTLSSSAYGTIRISADGRFDWQGFEKLVPSVIGAKAKGGGRIDFPLHLAKGLAASWDGAISFLFDEETEADGVSFLYKSASGGVRMSALPRDSVKELEVVAAGFSPVMIFFSQSAQ